MNRVATLAMWMHAEVPPLGSAKHVLLRSHCRAYDMAAIALKGMEKATTNFPKQRYLQEPFMLVRNRLLWRTSGPSVPGCESPNTCACRDTRTSVNEAPKCELCALAGEPASGLGGLRAHPAQMGPGANANHSTLHM